MSKDWYYDDAGTQTGPVSETSLKTKAADGSIQRSTLIWSEGMSDWSPAEQAMPLLFANNQLAVTDVYKASTVSQPALRQEAYSMTPMQVLFSFEGRIRRTTYWGYTVATLLLFGAIAVIPMSILDEDNPIAMIGMGIAFIPFVWTSLAIRIKRWHDRGKSGWWVWISLIPYVGDIWAFIENGCLEGDYGSNEYGPDPKQGQH